MALTAAELAFVRVNSGDNCPTYDVDDLTIQAIYDNDLPAEQGNGDLVRVIVFVLRRRWGIAINQVEMSGTGVTRSGSTQAQIKRLLDYWEAQAGMGVNGVLTMGAIDADLDTDEVSA